MTFFFQSSKEDVPREKTEPSLASDKDPWSLDAPEASEEKKDDSLPAPWANEMGEEKEVKDNFDDAWIKDETIPSVNPFETIPEDAIEKTPRKESDLGLSQIKLDTPPSIEEPPIPNADPTIAPIVAPEEAAFPAKEEKPEAKVNEDEEFACGEVMRAPIPKEEAIKRDPRKQRVEIEIPSEEELYARKRTRDRMVGAAVLLLTVVVFAPFILDSEESVKTETISTEIPSVEENKATLKIPSVASTGLEKKNDVELTGSSMGADASTAKANLRNEITDEELRKKKEEVLKEALKSEDEEVKTRMTQDKTKQEKPKQKEVAKVDKGYYLQIGVYSKKETADKLVTQINRQKVPAFLVEVKRKDKTLWAVRVGFFKSPNSKEAQGALGTLQLNGVNVEDAYFAQQK